MGGKLVAKPLYIKENLVMIKKNIFQIVLSLLLFTTISAQQNKSQIGLSIALNKAQIIDEYISKNEYSGSSISYVGIWENHTDTHISELIFDFNKINDLRSNNSKAIVYDFTTAYKYFYSVKETTLFDKPLHLFLGPGASIYFHYRDQKVANSSKALSVASLITVDIAVKAELILTEKFEVLSSISLSPFSFAGRTPSAKDSENLPTPVGFLYPFNLLNVKSSFGVKYKVTNNIFLRAGHSFRYLQIFKWDKFRLLQDSFYLQFGVNF